MDDHWESEIIEYGAVNITGFRLLDMNQRVVKEFLAQWKNLDSNASPGAGKDTISVSFGTIHARHCCIVFFFHKFKKIIYKL